MWVARPGVDTPWLADALAEARDRGLANLEQIAAAEAPGVGLSDELCLSYLRDNLYFHLGPRERRGLALYYQHACRLGLAPNGLELNRLMGRPTESPSI
jgi:chorismate dehydratase